jgi:hypothetical protein
VLQLIANGKAWLLAFAMRIASVGTRCRYLFLLEYFGIKSIRFDTIISIYFKIKVHFLNKTT